MLRILYFMLKKYFEPYFAKVKLLIGNQLEYIALKSN